MIDPKTLPPEAQRILRLINAYQKDEIPLAEMTSALPFLVRELDGLDDFTRMEFEWKVAEIQGLSEIPKEWGRKLTESEIEHVDELCDRMRDLLLGTDDDDEATTSNLPPL